MSIGSWLPSFTFDTPGDLSVVYATQRGRIVREGPLVHAWGELTTSTFTHTTSNGNLIITGFPIPIDQQERAYGTFDFNGITKSGYTQFKLMMLAPGGRSLVSASGSGVTQTGVTASDMPSGGVVLLNFNISYLAQECDYPKVERAYSPCGRMFMGDSITAQWSIPFAFSVNQGVAGNTTQDMLNRTGAALLTSASNTAVIMGGTNDAIQSLNMTTAVSNVLAMAQKCVGRKVVICTIPPIISSGTPISVTAYNAALKAMAAANGYPVADYYQQMLLQSGAQDGSLFLDGIHPNWLGYQKMQPVIEALL